MWRELKILTDGRWRVFLLNLLMSTIPFANAQRECAQRYDDAKALFDDGDRRACIATIDSTLADCRKDRDLACRLLFLKALAEAGEDSLERMRSDLEKLFRTDRRYTIKAYDPMMKGKKGEAELYNAWEQLKVDLHKDLGHWRVGVHSSLLLPLPRSTNDRIVLQGDEALAYSAPLGFEVALGAEWDAIPNLAIHGEFGATTLSYRANNDAITYKESLSMLSGMLSLKKMFWFRRGPFVPFVTLNGGTGWVVSDKAEIAREEGSDTRYLKALSLDRLGERTQRQFWGEGCIGIALKDRGRVFALEVAYRRALTQITREDGPYTNAQLMSDFYFVDGDISLDMMAARLSIQHIIAYHKKNRIHP